MNRLLLPNSSVLRGCAFDESSFRRAFRVQRRPGMFTTPKQVTLPVVKGLLYPGAILSGLINDIYDCTELGAEHSHQGSFCSGISSALGGLLLASHLSYFHSSATPLKSDSGRFLRLGKNFHAVCSDFMLFCSHLLGPKVEDISKPVNPFVFLGHLILGALAATYYVLVPIYMWIKDQIIPKGQPI